MITVDKLREFGADVDKGLSRCAGSEALYLRLVGMCVAELTGGELGEALEANDLERAFEIAHRLKGGVTNLSLDPVSAPLGELTELLRNRIPGDYSGLYAKVAEEAARLSEMLG